MSVKAIGRDIPFLREEPTILKAILFVERVQS